MTYYKRLYKSWGFEFNSWKSTQRSIEIAFQIRPKGDHPGIFFLVTVGSVGLDVCIVSSLHESDAQIGSVFDG